MQDVLEYLFAMIAFPTFTYLATDNGWAAAAAVFLMMFIIGTVKSIAPVK
jgi:hypothetical protein